MKVIGIDPGIANTGYAILEKEEDSVEFIDGGVIKTSPDDKNEERLLKLETEIAGILENNVLDYLAIEDIFSKRINPRAGLNIAMVMGVVFTTAAGSGIEVCSYSPRTIKMAVTGSGNASKEQVQKMLVNLIGIEDISDHLSDACAVAFCHINRRQNDILHNG